MSPTGDRVAWAALVVAIAALVVALTGGAIGLPGKKTVDRNDLKRGVVKSKHIKNDTVGLVDIAPDAEAALTEPAPPPPVVPRAYALVLGPGDVDEAHSRGIADGNITVNNSAFCIREVGFDPRHVQVTPQAADAPAKAILDDESACNGGTAVFFDGDLTYPEEFHVALYD